jgi:hypothetical protein
MRSLLRNIHIRIFSKALAVAMSFKMITLTITCCPHLCASAMCGAAQGEGVVLEMCLYARGAPGSDITDSPIYVEYIYGAMGPEISAKKQTIKSK